MPRRGGRPRRAGLDVLGNSVAAGPCGVPTLTLLKGQVGIPEGQGRWSE